jgi:ribokinase
VAVTSGAPRIVVIGSTMIDLVAYADRLPGDGETVVGSSYVTGFGGKGANQAVMAARFGAEVAMVNSLGDDDHGTAYVGQFATEGIDTTFIRRVPGSSGVAPIWVDRTGTNRIIIVPGANLEVRPDVAAEAVETLRPQVVIGQFEIPQATTAAGFRAARTLGATTVLNPAPAAGVDPSLLEVTDWLVPNGPEFELIAGVRLGESDHDRAAALTSFAERLGVSVVVTLGERGALVVPRDGTSSLVEAPRVEAVDTTGAGDAFVGAFAVGLALGRSVEAAVRLGCVAAADSVTRRGTQASYADRAAAARFLAATAT